MCPSHLSWRVENSYLQLLQPQPWASTATASSSSLIANAALHESRISKRATSIGTMPGTGYDDTAQGWGFDPLRRGAYKTTLTMAGRIAPTDAATGVIPSASLIR